MSKPENGAPTQPANAPKEKKFDIEHAKFLIKTIISHENMLQQSNMSKTEPVYFRNVCLLNKYDYSLVDKAIADEYNEVFDQANLIFYTGIGSTSLATAGWCFYRQIKYQRPILFARNIVFGGLCGLMSLPFWMFSLLGMIEKRFQVSDNLTVGFRLKTLRRLDEISEELGIYDEILAYKNMVKPRVNPRTQISKDRLNRPLGNITNAIISRDSKNTAPPKTPEQDAPVKPNSDPAESKKP